MVSYSSHYIDIVNMNKIMRLRYGKVFGFENSWEYPIVIVNLLPIDYLSASTKQYNKIKRL